MVMNQFVTTYRKDYLWPYVRTFGSKPSPEHLYKPQYRDQKSCDCNALPPLHASNEQVLGPSATKEEAWSRLGPMGPLLDPKVYPARVGAPPESQTSRFNQPNVFLQKLQEKYPFIYECLRNAPPDDLISRINRDRLRTTYEVDYCRMREYPDASYDELLRTAGVSGAPPCPEPVTLPGDPCRPGQRNVAYRPAIISKMGYCKSAGGGGGGGSGELAEHCRVKDIAQWNPFEKECEEREKDPVIEKWGQMLFRDTMHWHSPFPSGRSIKDKKIAITSSCF
ncbi:uncharacterized protein LOC123309109 isoform X1 [Coccinella septempunctata]|uniref:uncharacterized protein LOC123309109 isoform X1 n=1 Tax=Coccinella septempunctata TaxID=41139 RepID=UPI001D0748B7|nr:uncharacterized protein LOC123309109 isoform X1 [Coccinella septempunctata]